MPTAILQSKTHRITPRDLSITKTITHNNSRLYHENGRTYEFVGVDASGNRIYRDTAKGQ